MLPPAAPTTAGAVVPATTTTTSAGLPVTGDRTALYAGVGAALVAAGAVHFVAARRRRVRLVTPNE